MPPILLKERIFFILINFVIYSQLSPQGPDLVKRFRSYFTLGMCLNLPRRNALGHRIKTKYFPKLRVKSSKNILICPAPSWFATFNFCQDTGRGTKTICLERTVVFLQFLYALQGKLLCCFLRLIIAHLSTNINSFNCSKIKEQALKPVRL